LTPPPPGPTEYDFAVTLPDPPPSSAEHLRNLLEFEGLISELSSRFINLPPGDLDREIEDALRRVSEAVGLDLAILWQWDGEGRAIMAPTHAYYVHESLRPTEPLRQEHFPWSIQQMLAGRAVAVSSLEEFPPEADVDRESCRVFGVKSNLTLPLLVAGQPPVGALGLNAMRESRDWPDPLVKRLRLVAEVLTNALVRRRAEDDLRESQARLSLAADAAEAGLWTLDFSTGVFWATERALAIFGYGPDDAITMAEFEASVHPDDWEHVRRAIEQSAHTGESLDVEYRVFHRGDGSMRWVESRGRSRLASSGEPDRLMGVTIDVTDRRSRAEALRVSQERLASGVDLAGLAFYEVDYVAGTTWFDDRFRTLCGLPPDREQGLQPLEFWLEHVHPDDRPHLLQERELLHDGSRDRLSVEYRFLNPTDGQKWLHHLARVAARDAAGLTVRSLGALRDITAQKESEEALKQSYAEISRLKDQLQKESDYLRAEIEVADAHHEITGRSAAIQKVLRQAEQVAPTDTSVLVRGETGTGKEVLAQAIHRLSPRGRRVMVKVNCAALPSGLVESELFGREKGAFTGALARQAGRFEVADGSTLFLDEIGELPPDVQVKLLRVLQEGEFERLGSSRTIKVNVRVIAATNRDLADEIRTGRFREDLYYRLSVFPILMPPLRERPEDIPPLVWAFLKDLCTRMGKKITQVPRATMAALQRYPWPGNVRELRNVIEHGAIITTGDTLRVALLGEAAQEKAVPQTLADAEREHILRALEKAGGRIKGPKGAAAALGMNYGTLYGRMKKLGIRARPQADDDPV
jgi:formate hydrogenlyase transcriptional activator